jgi:hypothetical protein
MGCGDIGGTSLEGSSLCIMPEGHIYEGLITDANGRVPDVAEANGGTVVFSTPRTHVTASGITEESLRITREMAGASLIDCESRSDTLGVSYSPLPSRFEGEDLSWSMADYRALTSALPGTGMAYFCSNRENPNTVVLLSDSFHREALYSAVERFSSGSCGTMDAAHCGAALRSARVALGMPAVPEEESGHFWDLVGVGVTFTIVGIITHLISRWIDRGRGGPGDGGGGGGLNEAQIRALVRALSESGTVPVAALPPASETSSSFSSSDGFWAGLATACFVGAAALVADDATVVGVADDPIAAGAAVVGGIFLGISALVGEGSETSGPEA